MPGLVRAADTTALGQQILCPLEGRIVDDRRVDDLLGEDPLALIVPGHLGRVPEGDVVHIDEHFVLALGVPDMAAGVARLVRIGRS